MKPNEAASQQVTCPGCGLLMPKNPSVAGHRYINASAECWDVYTEVLATEYGNALLFRQVHQLTVDAYTSQHPGGKHPDKSVGIHLCGLYLRLERDVPEAQIPSLRKQLAEAVEVWPSFVPPTNLGATTVFDVALAESPDDHAKMVHKWAQTVWDAWSPQRDLIVEIARQATLKRPSGTV